MSFKTGAVVALMVALLLGTTGACVIGQGNTQRRVNEAEHKIGNTKYKSRTTIEKTITPPQTTVTVEIDPEPGEIAITWCDATGDKIQTDKSTGGRLIGTRPPGATTATVSASSGGQTAVIGGFSVDP
jgi:hypothetical protein